MIVYKVTNKLNGKVYIGLTIRTLKLRKYTMFEESNRLTQGLLYTAIRKYGKHNFEWIVIKRCSTTREMYKVRKHYITLYKSMNIEHGYNCHSGARYYTISDTTRKRLCVANDGENNPNYGIPMTNERKKLMYAGLCKQKKERRKKLREEYSKRTEKKCCRCKKVKKIDMFYKKKTNLDGLAYHCIECEKKRKRKC